MFAPLTGVEDNLSVSGLLGGGMKRHVVMGRRNLAARLKPQKVYLVKICVDRLHRQQQNAEW